MTVGKVWLIIIFIILCIGIDVSNVINHEKVHKQIQLYYGCEESQTHSSYHYYRLKGKDSASMHVSVVFTLLNTNAVIR